MRLRLTKSKPDRLLDTVGDSFAAALSGASRSKLLKASLIAGGVAAVTAGSAAISSIRRRAEGRDS
jgi:hypothetical protein